MELAALEEEDEEEEEGRAVRVVKKFGVPAFLEFTVAFMVAVSKYPVMNRAAEEQYFFMTHPFAYSENGEGINGKPSLRNTYNAHATTQTVPRTGATKSREYLCKHVRWHQQSTIVYR